MHHWGRYAVVAILTLLPMPWVAAPDTHAGVTVAFFVWVMLMHGLYWEWVRKD